MNMITIPATMYCIYLEILLTVHGAPIELQTVRTHETRATRGEVSDFHELFLDSGFTIKNPERLAYHYFKAHLGNLDFHAVSFIVVFDCSCVCVYVCVSVFVHVCKGRLRESFL